MTNAPKAIELALTETIRAFTTLGDDVSIRPWQALASVITDGNYARKLPYIDIRCAPPNSNDEDTTRICTASILCGTTAEDDPDHAAIRMLYEGVQGVTDSIYFQFRRGENAELTAFKASLTDYAPIMIFGGITFGDGPAPYDDDGINMIGITISVHYSHAAS